MYIQGGSFIKAKRIPLQFFRHTKYNTKVCSIRRILTYFVGFHSLEFLRKVVNYSFLNRTIQKKLHFSFLDIEEIKEPTS